MSRNARRILPGLAYHVTQRGANRRKIFFSAAHRNIYLRRCTYAGRPFGDEEFLARLENRFQRNWRRWS